MKRYNRTSNYHYTRWAGDSCVYCGQEAEVLDHAYPASREPGLAPSGMLILVPACTECNGIAGYKVHLTIEDRRDDVQNRLKEKYKKLLMMPDWTDEELGHLKGRLRESVINNLEARRRMRLRIHHRE